MRCTNGRGLTFQVFGGLEGGCLDLVNGAFNGIKGIDNLASRYFFGEHLLVLTIIVFGQHLFCRLWI